MPLDPQAQALLAAFAQAPTIDFAQLTVPAYRASLAAGGAFARAMPSPPRRTGGFRCRTVSCPHGCIGPPPTGRCR